MHAMCPHITSIGTLPACVEASICTGEPLYNGPSDKMSTSL